MTSVARLKVGLQERFRRVAKADWRVVDRELGYLRDFVLESPRLGGLVASIERSDATLDPETWVSDNFSHRAYDWPDTESGRAKVAWYLVNKLAVIGDGRKLGEFAWNATGNTSFEEAVPALAIAIAEPVVDRLVEMLGEADNIAYILGRYRRRFEWWDRERLFAAFRADTEHGEKVYADDVRRYLFEQGVDYPFSEPLSASGRADVLADVDEDRPLVCEIKVFDGEGRGLAYLSKGVRQILHYAHDYGRTEAYLVIIDITGVDMQLPSDGVSGQWPARLDVGGVTVFLVHLRARPPEPASRLGRAAPRVVRRDQLVSGGD
jgi:hypothetical protein